MRSATPKLLHEVCGRALIAWPVTAAQAAGARKVVVVQGPDRPLQHVLLAPVSLGDGACTAARSVVSDDAPPGALGIARARQTNIEGYTERRRRRSSGEQEPKVSADPPGGRPGGQAG